MSRGRIVLTAILVLVGSLLVWGLNRKSAPPEVPFTKVTRATVISALNTNGKVEPIEWASARAERQGVVRKVFVKLGQQVAQGAQIVALDVSDAASDLAAAHAQIASAQAQEQVLQQGGPQSERTQIENDVASARTGLQNAQKEYDALQRLVAKQAATRIELESARQRVEQAQLQIAALERRRASLVAPTDLPVARARLNEAESSASLARTNLSRSVVRAPIDGTVYQFDLKVGSFVNPGDLVANVGKLAQVRVTVYVDEPDLGRVQTGMPVTISWTALPGRQWKGVVDKVPTQVVALGARQVGEVGCIIDNPDRDLLPGTNIDAEIQSRVVPNAISMPKEALRREGGVNGVYLLQRDRLAWRPVKIGVSSYTRAEVLQGLSDGDSIALPTDKPVKNGLKVAPVYP